MSQFNGMIRGWGADEKDIKFVPAGHQRLYRPDLFIEGDAHYAEVIIDKQIQIEDSQAYAEIVGIELQTRTELGLEEEEK